MVFNKSLEDLALLIVSPLLAVAIYFVLIQGGLSLENYATLAAISFAVGLVTDRAIEKLQDLAGSLLGNGKKNQNNDEENDDKTEKVLIKIQDDVESIKSRSNQDKTE